MGPRLVAVFTLLSITALVTAQGTVSPELKALADAERAFAKAATAKGVRDSFLEFFAEDAIALTPAPTSAVERLKARKPVPFSVNELTWEPRTGEIAASGDLGWLTGPATFVDRSDPAVKPSYSNYLSVWRRQGNGAWKVYIDVGVNTPEPVAFAPGFTPQPFPAKYRGSTDKAAASAALEQADRELNQNLPITGTPAAYAERLAPAARLHPGGVQTPVGANRSGSARGARRLGPHDERRRVRESGDPATATGVRGEAPRPRTAPTSASQARGGEVVDRRRRDAARPLLTVTRRLHRITSRMSRRVTRASRTDRRRGRRPSPRRRRSKSGRAC